MIDAKIISEKPVSFIQVMKELKKTKKEELGFRAKKTFEYLNKFIKLNEKQYEEVYKSISELGLPRLKEEHIIKIIDLWPADKEGLKLLFSTDNLSFKTEQLQQVIDVLKKSKK